MEEYNESAYKKWDQEALIKCPHCERTFLPDRLDIHLRSCKADRPLKAPLTKSRYGIAKASNNEVID